MILDSSMVIQYSSMARRKPDAGIYNQEIVSVVEDFGSKLQMVPLMASEDNLFMGSQP